MTKKLVMVCYAGNKPIPGILETTVVWHIYLVDVWRGDIPAEGKIIGSWHLPSVGRYTRIALADMDKEQLKEWKVISLC